MKQNNLFTVDIDEVYVQSCCAENPTASQQNTEDTGKTELLTANQRNLLRLLDDKAVRKVCCFGGILMQRENENGSPILSFVVKGTSDVEYERMCKNYEEIYRIGSVLPLIRYDFLFKERFVASGTHFSVFNFICYPNHLSLRQYCEDGNRSIPLDEMMRKLVHLLVAHSNACGEQYRCLSCLSLDTIFVSKEGKLLLLPLQAFHNHFPREIAPEVGHYPELCDARSDLYSAAYVSLEVSFGGKLPEMPALGEGKIKDCLMGVVQCRPTLQNIASLMGSNSNAGPRWNIAPAAAMEPSAPRKAHAIGFAGWFKALWKRITDYFSGLPREPKSEVSGTMLQYEKPAFRPITDFDYVNEE